MNPVQLKKDFHKLIDDFEDVNMLEDLFDVIFQFQQHSTTNEVLDELTGAQQARLNTSLQQARAGKTQADDRVRARAKSWFVK